MARAEFIPVEIAPIPERPIEDLSQVLSEAEAFADRTGESFGAVLLRGATKEQFDLCTAALVGPVNDELVEEYDFRRAQALHTDVMGRPINDITAHYTVSGTVDFAIIPDMRLRYGLRAILPRHKAAADLLEGGQLSSRLLRDRDAPRLPLRALVASLAPDDLMLFDSTQPHLTAHVSKDRKSLASFRV